MTLLFLKIYLSCHFPKVNQKPDFEMLLAFKWAILQCQYLLGLANYGFWTYSFPIMSLKARLCKTPTRFISLIRDVLT